MTTLYMVAAQSCDQGIRGEVAQRLGSDLMRKVARVVHGIVFLDDTLVNDANKVAVYRLLVGNHCEVDDILHDTHLAQLFREGYQAERSASALIRITIERV